MKWNEILKNNPELKEYSEEQLELLFGVAEAGKKKRQDYLDGKHNQSEKTDD